MFEMINKSLHTGDIVQDCKLATVTGVFKKEKSLSNTMKQCCLLAAPV